MNQFGATSGSTRTTITLSQIITHTLEKLHRLFPDLRVVYTILDDIGKQTIAVSAESPAFPAPTADSQDCVLPLEYLAALKQNLLVSIEDIASDPHARALQEPYSHIHCAALLATSLCLPSGECGVLSLHAMQPRLWSDFERESLIFAAENADLAINNARMQDEKRELERSLRRANKRITNILDSINDVFLSLDRTWRITFANTRAEQLMRHSRQEMLGAVLWELFPHLKTYPFHTRLQQVLTHQIAQQFEERFPKTGLWLDVSVYPSQDGLSIYARDITSHKRAEEELRLGIDKIQRGLNGVVQAMSHAVEIQDPYTAGHQRRVSVLAARIALVMGLPVTQVEEIRIAGLLHDLGKIAVPAEILSRPSSLTPAELSIIQMHPEVGYNILKDIEFAAPIALVALQHHERLDGSGYPQKLKGAEIILEARILAVADVVEAMASHRPYRPALELQKALEEILGGRGTRYDALAVDACLLLLQNSEFDLELLLSADQTTL